MGNGGGGGGGGGARFSGDRKDADPATGASNNFCVMDKGAICGNGARVSGDRKDIDPPASGTGAKPNGEICDDIGNAAKLVEVLIPEKSIPDWIDF